MKNISALLLLASSIGCVAQAPQIKSNATVYIEPSAGFETYLAAAIVKKHVPVAVIEDKARAAYLIRSTLTQPVSSQPAVVVNNTNAIGPNVRADGFPSRGYGTYGREIDSASIAVIDAQTSQIVFAYSAGKLQKQSAAEACAKHLKEFIEKPKK